MEAEALFMDADFKGVPRELPERQRVHARLFMDAPFTNAKRTPFIDAEAPFMAAEALLIEAKQAKDAVN